MINFDFIQKHLSKAMDDVEEAREQGHLLFTTDFFKKHTAEPNYLESGFKGKTNHPSFVKDDSHSFLFKLKPKLSASKAIESLLRDHETVIDCGAALDIAYYLALLGMMRELHGEEVGNHRFDTLFGDEQGLCSQERRMMICPYGPPSGYVYKEQYPDFPSHPLSMLFRRSDFRGSNLTPSLGDIITYQGSDAYVQKHPMGVDSAYNCIVFAHTPLQVRSFGFGTQPLSEEQIKELHHEAYQADPSLESLAYHTHQAKHNLVQTKQASVEPLGFVAYCYKLRLVDLLPLLKNPLPEIIRGMDASLYQQKLFDRNIRSSIQAEQGKPVARLTNMEELTQKLASLKVEPTSIAPQVKTPKAFLPSGQKELLPTSKTLKQPPKTSKKKSQKKH